MGLAEEIDLDNFLRNFALMRIYPSKQKGITLRGKYEFFAEPDNGKEIISDSYELEINISGKLPFTLPIVKEIGGRIPNNPDLHINENQSICLGSSVQLLSILFQNPTLDEFARKCITPYLYAVSYKALYGGEFIFGELSHGPAGLVEDYKKHFNVKTKQQVIEVLLLISLRLRVANKKKCPCGCAIRLGKCNYNKLIKNFRSMAPRSWYRKEYENLSYYYLYNHSNPHKYSSMH
ncbi:hypothetical protein [Leptospira koniambonensis]|uniref:hypothetical protein n=1 Tax=Leptospira koniambonensis TaxID=2484950 RepID=UPI003EBE5C05